MSDNLSSYTPNPHINTPAEDATEETQLKAALATSAVTLIGCIVAGVKIGASKGHPFIGGFLGVQVAYIASMVITPIIAPHHDETWKRLNNPDIVHPSDGAATPDARKPVEVYNPSTAEIAHNLNGSAKTWTRDRQLGVAGLIGTILSNRTLNAGQSQALADEANTEANDIQSTIRRAVGEDARSAERRARFLANKLAYPGISDADNNRLVDFTMPPA